MMNVLTKATKKSSVLAKAIVPPRKYPRVEREDDGPGPSHSRDRREYGRSRDRDRSRSRSPAKRKGNERKGFRRYRKYGGKKSDGKGAAKDSNDSKK